MTASRKGMFDSDNASRTERESRFAQLIAMIWSFQCCHATTSSEICSCVKDSIEVEMLKLGSTVGYKASRVRYVEFLQVGCGLVESWKASLSKCTMCCWQTRSIKDIFRYMKLKMMIHTQFCNLESWEVCIPNPILRDTPHSKLDWCKSCTCLHRSHWEVIYWVQSFYW